MTSADAALPSASFPSSSSASKESAATTYSSSTSISSPTASDSLDRRKPLPTHDPTLKPSASILANPHEAPPPSSASRKPSALKAAFIPAQPGRLAKKKSGVALGKSFQRPVPLPGDVKHEGGEVLQVDPRGQQASAGDGVVLPPASPHSPPPNSTPEAPGGTGAPAGFPFSGSSSAASPNTFPATSPEGSVDSSVLADDDDGASLPSTGGFSGPSSSSNQGRSRTDTMSTTNSSFSSSSSSHSCAIRFAPLPVSGRLKRSSSITIGIAARSQMLQSQGAGRVGANYYQQPRGAAAAAAAAANAQQRGRLQFSGAYPSPRAATSALGGHPGGTSTPNDVIDLGEEISKRAKSAWRRMMGSSKETGPAATAIIPTPASASKGQQVITPTVNDAKQARGSGNSATTTPIAGTPQPTSTASASTAPAKSGSLGDKTPRRPSSPLESLTSSEDSLSSSNSSSKDACSTHAYSHLSQGSHQDHFPGVAHHLLHPSSLEHDFSEDDAGGEGSQTPRAGMQRRLSTGAFLGGLSLRHMQQDRRREFGGHDDEDELERERQEEQVIQQEGQPTTADTPAAPRHTHAHQSLVTPAHNPEEEKFVDVPQAGQVEDGEAGPGDEEEEEDEEELREAERLANNSLRRGAKGAGVEVVHSSSSPPSSTN